MDLVRNVADGVFPWLKVMSDLPEDHPSQMVPMLDLRVWVQHDQSGPDRLGWMFFEKEVNTTRVLRATSALSWRSKLVSMNQGGLQEIEEHDQQGPHQPGD